MKAYDELANREYFECLESKDFDYTKIARYLRAISKGVYSEEEHSFADMLNATQAQVKAWEKVDKEDDKDESDFVTIYDKDGNVLGQISQKILDKFLKEAV
jgi:DNA-binding transcriptional regulator YiaG